MGIVSNRAIWESVGWGEYFAEAKRKLQPFFKKYPNLIGNIVLDVGARSFSLYAAGQNPDKVVTVDWAHDTKVINDSVLHVRADIERLLVNYSRDRSLMNTEVRHFLGKNRRCPAFDTVTFCSVLNYVPYKDVLGQALFLVRLGGTIVILNKPGMTLGNRAHLLHKDGVKDNHKLLEYCRKTMKLDPLLVLEMRDGEDWEKTSIDECTQDGLIFATFRKQ